MKIDEQRIRDVSEGIIQAVDEGVVPQNSVYLAANFLFDKKLGRAVMRGGSSMLGSQIADGKECIGLYSHITTAGVKVPLAVFNDATDTNADIYGYTSAWAKVKENITAGARVRFETFLDTTVAVNGAEAMATADGTSWITTGGNLDVGNMPTATLVKEWQDKLYAAGDPSYPDRLYFSSTPVVGAISWTSGNGYIDIEPEEGAGAISALAKVPGYFLVFKKRSLKRWDGASTYPESLMKIGTVSQEAVVETRQSCFFFNKLGIFETTGGYPRKVSRRIQDIIYAIPSSYYGKVSGWGDNDNVYFSIGDITISGTTIKNCVAVYNIDSQSCALLSFPNEFKRWGNYVDANDDEIIMAGDDDGNVWKLFDGSTDDAGAMIKWMIQFHAQEFGSRGRYKDISKAVVYTKNAAGTISCRVDEAVDFAPLKTAIKNPVQELTEHLNGRYFEFRLQGQGRGTEIIGIDFPEIDVSLNYGQ